jgi:hypothetical protein
MTGPQPFPIIAALSLSARIPPLLARWLSLSGGGAKLRLHQDWLFSANDTPQSSLDQRPWYCHQ